MKIVDEERDGVQVKMFYPENEIKSLVIAIHGFGGDSESSVIKALARELTAKDILVLTFDLPCHGKDKNKDVLRLGECLSYLEKIINFSMRTFKDIPISFFATSFGCFILLNHLKNHDIIYNKIILKSPAIFMDKTLKENILKDHGYSLDDLIRSPLDLGYEREILIDKFFLNELEKSNLNNHFFPNHIDIIQGDKDDVVNIYDNEKFFSKNFKNYSLHYIKGADHRFKNPGELEKVLKISKNILN